jgi:hypothetical protein
MILLPTQASMTRAKLFRYGLIGVALLAIGLGGFLYFIWGEKYSLTLTELEIQEHADQYFPKHKQYLRIFDLAARNPEIHLDENPDRVRVGLELGVTIKGFDMEFRGRAAVSGTIRYAADKGAFYLDNAKVDQVKIAGIPEKFTSKIDDMTSMALKEWCELFPVYRLKDDRLKHRFAKGVLKQVHVREKKMIVIFGVGDGS